MAPNTLFQALISFERAGWEGAFARRVIGSTPSEVYVIKRLPLIPILLAPFLFATTGDALTDEELLPIRDGFEGRRDTYLKDYLAAPIYEFDEGIVASGTHISDARWIWYPGEMADRSAPIGARHFQRSVVIPEGRVLQKAYCAFAADNYGDILINGERVGRSSGFQKATVLDITRRLTETENHIEVSAHNAGDAPNPAGIAGVIHLEYSDGPPQLIYTDADWAVRKETETAWSPAEVLGTTGMAPWGPVGLEVEGYVNRYVFTRLTYALAALYLNEDLSQANAYIIESVDQIRRQHQSVGEFGLHWMGGAFYRIYGLFGPSGTRGELLNPEASQKVWQLFADWAVEECDIANVNPEYTWRLWGSENHSAQRDATTWAAARMIALEARGRNLVYADGHSPEAHLEASRAFMKRYFRERIKRGMLVEISPSGYGSRTLQGWHNIYDFSTDPELKQLAISALDLWWAEWAQEQLGQMRGGGKTRLYPGAWALSGHDRNRAMSWFYLGEGHPAHQHETLPVIATTEYRLPLVVMDIALDPEGRGVYECRSRKLGRHLSYESSLKLSKPNEPVYDVDPEYGGIVRYSYCTPDFIMGTLLLENRPKEYWTAISQQNRWHGIIFSGDRDSTLYPRCATSRSTYNGQWAIQHKGTLITQKLRDSDQAGAMRVCASEDLKREEENGWLFLEATGAYAAVKIVHGGSTWENKRWLRCEDEFTPIIFEVVRKQDFNHDYNAFKDAIAKQHITLEQGVLEYKGLQDSGEFTFYTESDRAPELNGEPIALAPDYGIQSPFIVSRWAEGVVKIQKDTRVLTIDVRHNDAT